MRTSRMLAAALFALPIALAQAAGPYDGSYHGMSSLTRGQPPTCNPPREVTWTIADNHVKVQYGNVPINAEVGADGTFRKDVSYMAGRTQATATMTGRAANGAIDADIESFACKYHYALKKG